MDTSHVIYSFFSLDKAFIAAIVVPLFIIVVIVIFFVMLWKSFQGKDENTSMNKVSTDISNFVTKVEQSIL